MLRVKKLLAGCLLLLLAGACEPGMPEGAARGDKYENFEKFDAHVARLADSLGEKYAIREYYFDAECIYQARDLSKLATEMLDLGGFCPRLLGEGLDARRRQYVSRFELQGERMEFRTSAEGDYVDLDLVLPVLERVARRQAPGCDYYLSNRNGGQAGFLVFASHAALVAAVAEGYPCSLTGSDWRWDEQWPWGVYSEVTLPGPLPGFPQLEASYYQTLTELRRQGYDVPPLTRPRLYITDLFKTSSVDILVDGGPDPASSNKVEGRTVRCFWESWGALLAYTLVKHYGGQPALYDKTTGRRTELAPAAYLRKAEQAFGRR